MDRRPVLQTNCKGWGALSKQESVDVSPSGGQRKLHPPRKGGSEARVRAIRAKKGEEGTAFREKDQHVQGS